MWQLYLLTIVAGAVSTALAGSNATLAEKLGQPITAGLIVQLVTILSLLVVGLWRGGMDWPGGAKLAELPWWAWIGGIGGATVLLAQLMAAQKVGASPFLAITVTAGVVVSIAMDRFGWLGFEQTDIHLTRYAGAGLMILGVLLIAKN